MKSPLPIDLTTLVNEVCCMSVHAACCIVPCNQHTQVLWARAVLQELVSRNGTVFCALCMYEAENYQSAIDGGAMNLAGPLADVCDSEHLTFLQLYVDSPYLHVPCPF